MLAVVSASVALIAPARHTVLRITGGLLLRADGYESADVGVVSEGEEPGAGELELSDLYTEGVVARVVVLAVSPGVIEREFARRGFAREGSVFINLHGLGVPDSAVTRVEAGEGGTTESTRALAGWIRDHPVRVIVVMNPSHTRRYRRALMRLWPAGVPEPRVIQPRLSEFQATDWWQSRRTRREGIVELEKLAFDYLRHPW
jgi:hypothetical protein